MTLAGICIDAVNPAGRAPLSVLRELGVSLVRQVARPEPEFASYQAEVLAGSGIASAFVFTPQSFTSDDWAAEAVAYCQSYQPTIAIIGNEPDAYLDGQDHDASWAQTPREYRALWDLIAPRILEGCPTTRLCIAGQMHWANVYAGMWLNELRNGGPLVGASLIDVHCYQMELGRPDTVALIQKALDLYRRLSRLEPTVLEWTTPDEDVVAVARLLRREAAASAWFAFSDGMVAGHGITDADWNPYATYFALRAGLMPAAYAGV